MNRLISLLLVFLMTLSFTSFASESSTYSYECDLTLNNAIDKFTLGSAEGCTNASGQIGSDGDGYYIEIDTAAGSGRMIMSADTDIPEFEIKNDRFYVFNVDVETSTTGFLFLFTQNGQTNYNNKEHYMSYIRCSNLDDTLGLYAATQTLVQKTIKEISGKGQKNSISFVCNGKNLETVYVNNEKVTLTQEIKERISELPSRLSKIGFLLVNWGSGPAKLSNISIKEMTSLTLTSANEIIDIGIYGGNADVSFNNPLYTVGSAIIYDKNQTQIVAELQINGKTVTVTPEKSLKPNEEYTLKLTNVTDICGQTIPSAELSLKTVTKDPLYIEEEFVSSDGISKFSADNGSLDFSGGTMLHSVGGGASSVIDYTAFVTSHNITEGRYAREITYTANSADGKKEFFKFGPSAGDCLVEASEKSGETGLWLKAFDGTDLNTKIPLNTAFDLAAVYDAVAGGYDVYYNKSKINSDKITISADNFKNANSFMRTAGAGTVYDTLDNIRYYKISDYSALKLLSASVSDGDTVKCYTDKLEFGFSQDITASSLSSVSLKTKEGAGVSIEASVDSSDTKKLIVNINEMLLANTDYVLDISGIKGNSPLYKEGIITLKTSDSINVTAPQISGTAVDSFGNLRTGELTASINVNNSTYTGETNSCALVIMVYENYKLLDVKTKSVNSLSSTDTNIEASVSIGAVNENVYVKVYAVDSLKTMSPLCPSYTID